jgi:hypothetical protein
MSDRALRILQVSTADIGGGAEKWPGISSRGTALVVTMRGWRSAGGAVTTPRRRRPKPQVPQPMVDAYLEWYRELAERVRPLVQRR